MVRVLHVLGEERERERETYTSGSLETICTTTEKE